MDNNGKHMDEIRNEHPCNYHDARAGEPCWTVPSGSIDFLDLYALCGRRIKAAGFNGKITPSDALPFKKSSTKKEVHA